jgi:hypothetical protein
MKRDQVHYHETGDLVVLVEQTLFRVCQTIAFHRFGRLIYADIQVHRAFLEREPSVLMDVLTLPPGEGISADGESDAKPFELQGDTVDEFKALCWGLYVL